MLYASYASYALYGLMAYLSLKAFKLEVFIFATIPRCVTPKGRGKLFMRN